jgi:hypothetical protein
MHQKSFRFCRMHFIIVQLQRQSTKVLDQFSRVKNSSPLHIFPLEDRGNDICINASMFQVSIDICDHSSPNFVWETRVHI